MDEAVVAIEVDLHLAVGVEIAASSCSVATSNSRHAAAPDGQVDLAAAVVGDAVVPDLLHRRVLLGEDRPLPADGVVAAGPGRGGRPDVVVLHGDAVDHVVDQAAVELVEMVEAAAAEAGHPPPNRPSQTSPVFLSTSMAVITRQGRPSFSRPTADLAGPLVEQARPSSVPIQTLGPSALTAKTWSLGRPSFDGEVLPLRIDVRQACRVPVRGAVRRPRGRPGGARPRPEAALRILGPLDRLPEVGKPLTRPMAAEIAIIRIVQHPMSAMSEVRKKARSRFSCFAIEYLDSWVLNIGSVLQRLEVLDRDR